MKTAVSFTVHQHIGYGQPSKPGFIRRFSHVFVHVGAYEGLEKLYKERQEYGGICDDRVKAELQVIMRDVDFVSMVVDNSTNEFIGYLIAGTNHIFDIFIKEGYRLRGYALGLIDEFKKRAGEFYPELHTGWKGDDYGFTKLLTKAGFTVTSYYDVESLDFCRSEAKTSVPEDFHQKVLDNVGRSYIDFRGDYAVVDGHYTLAELESLLAQARKELK